MLVSTINGTGAGIEFIYVVLFIIYAPRKEKAKMLGLLTFVLSVFGAVALVSLFALHGKGRKLFCGFAATIFSIIMYASPLSIMVSYFLPLVIYLSTS
jgi:solute carrier family 50 protein (sugar transporter)